LNFAAKRRVLYAGLLLFTLWPLVHIYLVTHFDMSAWKLAGWGMYATPRPSSSGIAVFGRRMGSQHFEELRSAPAAWQAQASQFLDRQRWLGQLIHPNDLARSFKEQRPEFTDLRIIVYTPALDRHTGMIVMTQLVYEYPASGP
jgi:hypothetical protein